MRDSDQFHYVTVCGVSKCVRVGVIVHAAHSYEILERYECAYTSTCTRVVNMQIQLQKNMV